MSKLGAEAATRHNGHRPATDAEEALATRLIERHQAAKEEAA